MKVAYVNKKYEVGTSVKFDDYEITLEEAKMVQDKKIQMQCS
ncbi:hypothetical protein [Anaerosphaera aminiphila]|nr:hypothetical protein [Anaerosphaera aminiphila]